MNDEGTTMLPTLVDRVATLDRVRKDFLSAVGAATEAQRRFRPAPDSWSMLEVTEHCVLAEEKSVLGMLKGPPPGTTVTPVAHVRMWMVRLVMKSDIRVRVPVARVLPTGDATLPELAARWDESRRGLAAFLERITDADAGAARFRHPIGGWVSAGEGVAFLAGHIDHHTRQLARIRRAAGFPSA
jgi:hypothetical protein